MIDTTARAKTKDDTHRSISNNEDYSENDNDNDELRTPQLISVPSLPILSLRHLQCPAQP